MKGLLDTSVIVGLEADRVVAPLPDEAAISVITVEELTLGVLMAEHRGAADLAARRRRTLEAMTAQFDPLPVTKAVAVACAEVRARGRAAGIRLAPFDALICATAIAHGIPLFTQDAQQASAPGVDGHVV